MIVPWFENNIISVILRNLHFYFFGSSWLLYALVIFAFFYILYLSLYKNNKKYLQQPVPLGIYKYNGSNLINKLALTLCIATLALYSLTIYSLENSLFNNYDLMSLNTIYIFLKGMKATYNVSRLCPLSFFDLNVIYAISHNFYIVNLFIIAKQVLIACLLFNFLNFIPVTKRLFTISGILLTPALFWINNIIFPEQNVLIFVLASLIFLKKFFNNGQAANLLYFAVFTNLAVYSKETTIIFYLGTLLYSAVYQTYRGNINFSNIWNPIRLAKLFPAETIIFCSFIIFAVFYLINVIPSAENIYVYERNSSFAKIFWLYKFEFFIILTAWIVAIKKCCKQTTESASIFNEGLLCGATAILLFISFYLKITPILSHVNHKSYYVVISAIFGIIYISQNIQSKKILITFFSILVIYSSITNYTLYRQETGISYRQTADFFSQRLETEDKLNIMISENSEPSGWTFETWSYAYKYYFPNKDITFKFPILTESNPNAKFSLYIYQKYSEVMTKIVGTQQLSAGDYFIIKKGIADMDFERIKDHPHELVYENKLFKVYQIK